MHPASFLTSARQYCSRLSGWDISSLELWLHVGAAETTDSDDGEGGRALGAVRVAGLRMEGAEVVHGQVVLSDRQSTPLRDACLCWRQKQPQQQGIGGSIESNNNPNIPMMGYGQRAQGMPPVPVYRNAHRGEAVGEVHMDFKLDAPISPGADRLSFLYRNVCVLLEAD